jgi:hypothetical protein
MGQDSIDSSVNSNVYVLEKLQALRRYLDQFLSGLNSMCERLHARIVGERDTNAEPDHDARPDTGGAPARASARSLVGARVSRSHFWPRQRMAAVAKT